jgi:AraC-like DNA-binding protein
LTEVEHYHDFSELVIVSRGVGVQCLEGMDLPIAAGDVFLLCGKQRHYFHHREQLVLINVMYDHERIALPENELRRMPGYCAMFMLEPAYRKQHRFASRLHLSRDHLARVEAITGRMECECSQKDSGYEIVLRAKLLELIAYLSRAYERGKSTEAQSLLRVSNVIGAMEKDYSEQWKLDDFVAIAHMSKSNLLAVFRKATGQTPIDYLTGIRIQRATEVLLTTDENITEIAFAVGFNDSNYFTRQFRKATGRSPREFRAHHHRH